MNNTTDCLPNDVCPSCLEGRLKDGHCDHVTRLADGREVTVKDLPCGCCDQCGARFYGPDATDQIEAAILKTLESLSPAEVVRFVEMSGLPEDELSEKLGFGPKTIYRWRRGAQRPSKSLSALLAIVAWHPDLLNWLSQEGWKQGPLVAHAASQTPSRTSSQFAPRIRPATPRLDKRRIARDQAIDPHDYREGGIMAGDRLRTAWTNEIAEFFNLAGARA